MTMSKPVQIDIEEIFKKKSGGLHHVFPGFFYRYLKGIIHEDEINAFLKNNYHKNGVDFLDESLKTFGGSEKIIGTEHLPENSNVIFAANHPLGSIDGLSLIRAVHHRYGRVKVLVNDILLTVEPLQEFFIGFNKHGRTKREIIKELNSVLKSDAPLIYFPSGLVSRKIDGEVQDTEWKKTFITNASKYKRDIIPTHISGELSSFFYNIYKFRQIFHIRTNIEMLYLPHEMFKLKQKELHITFGQPISNEMFSDNRMHSHQAAQIREHIYKLADCPGLEFEPEI
ncbi:MAG: 1-acyl-sn-glycerol-3-phosphate acyltransferase [Bacteroidota bacterium]|nr:1-acyl-sn-glycerol-3-phosphate acyltransferase [Bacteroidota bacterium]